MQRVWCAIVGCPQREKRGGVTPDGQALPDWLSWSTHPVGFGVGIWWLDKTTADLDVGLYEHDQSFNLADLVERSHNSLVLRYCLPGVLVVPHRHRLRLPVFLICLVDIKSKLEYRDIECVDRRPATNRC
ncbi:uncharacterized protein LOC62_02G003303 [Vanrija pseudolonga]|uniref:Uncharacterized protein n=1 Tax=Vanrija pseudolonga TaxID=143232 RepID=A0AAF0Y5L6_9TREE|nr:hypothetical protein LOC62_02G003303 [Vanrija pseudolonga]